jgi:hypothetical protein
VIALTFPAPVTELSKPIKVCSEWSHAGGEFPGAEILKGTGALPVEFPSLLVEFE